MAKTNFTAGFKDSAMSAYGLGAFAAFTLLMVGLYFLDLDPASLAAKAREKWGTS